MDNEQKDKKRINITVKSVLLGTVVLLILLVGSALLLSTFNNPWGIRAFSVLSGSMEPAIKEGSLIFTREKDSYERGEIITYTPVSGRINGTTLPLTHRIININESNSEVLYITQGDANATPDQDPVPHSNVIGSTIFALPYVGYLIDFARTPLGYIVLILVPAIILIYEEIGNMIRSWRQYKLKKRIRENKKLYDLAPKV